MFNKFKVIKNKATQGFTLVEILVVLVIVAILAGLAFVSYRGYVDKGYASEAELLLKEVSSASEMYEAMHEMEVMCAKLASRRITLFSRIQIQKAQSECQFAAEKGNVTLFLKANEYFHEAIYKSTQNPFLAELALSFRKRTQVSRSQKFKSKKDLLKAIKEHDTLVNYILGNEKKITENELLARLSQPIIETLSHNSN
mgnify:CR=1 FL=1